MLCGGFALFCDILNALLDEPTTYTGPSSLGMVTANVWVLS